MDKVSQRIIARAIVLFAERGFERVTVRDITHACSIHMPTLYRKFTDKEQLYRAVVRESIIRSTAEVMQAIHDEKLPPEERLYRYVLVSMRQIVERRPHTRILDRELLDSIDPAGLEALIDEIVLPLYAVVAGVVRQLVPNAETFKHAFELGSLAFAAAKLLTFRRHVWPDQDATTELDTIATEITQSVLLQLKVTASRRRGKTTDRMNELMEANRHLEALVSRVLVDNANLREQLKAAPVPRR